MFFGRLILSTGILVTLGIIGSLIYIRFDNKDFFGGKKVGMIVGSVGAILGGFLFDLFFRLPIFKFLLEIPFLQFLLVNKVDINFIASFLGIWLFLFTYEYVSEHTERS